MSEEKTDPATPEAKRDSVAPDLAEDRAVKALEGVALALIELAQVQARIAAAEERKAECFEQMLPYLELIPQRMLDMIEQGFGARTMK